MKPRPSPSRSRARARARNRYNTAGLCSAFAVVPSDSLRRRFRRAAAGVLPDMSLFGLEATAAAYARGGAWRARLLAYLRANEQAARAHLAAHAPELAVDATPLESTYLLWIDCERLVALLRAAGAPPSALSPADFFERRARVGLSEGRFFGSARHVRLNLGTSRATLELALARMTGAVRELRKEAAAAAGAAGVE